MWNRLNARRLIVVGVFVLLVSAIQWSKTDPLLLFCEDIGAEFLPKIRHAYLHPWDTFRNKPTPEYIYGTANAGLEGAISFPATLPFVPALLSKIAPTELGALMRFEWRLTGLFMLVSMVAMYAFLRRRELDPFIAAAAAIFFPWGGAIFAEWRHVAPLRGRLLLPLVCLAVSAFFQRPSYRRGALVGIALVACLAQSFQLYWILPMVAVWTLVTLISQRAVVMTTLRGDPALARRVIGAAAFAAAIVAVVFAPPWMRGAADFTGSVSPDKLSRPARFFSYLYLGAKPDDNFFLFPDFHSTLMPLDDGSSVGPVILAGCFLAIARALGRLLPRGRTAPTSALSSLTAVGWSLLGVGLVLGYLSHLPQEWLFSVRGDEVYFRWIHMRAPAMVALLLHCTRRTWLVMAFVGQAILAAEAWTCWAREPLSLRARLFHVAGALSLYASSLWIAARLAHLTWGGVGHPMAIAIVGATLLSVALLVDGKRSTRWIGGLVLCSLAASAALSVTSDNVKRTLAWADDGSLRYDRARALLERVPAPVQRQYEYRVVLLTDMFSRNDCFLLEAACDNSYPIKHFPSSAARFFDAVGGVRELNAPYSVFFNYPRLSEIGLTSFLGLRYYLLQGRTASLMRGKRYLKGPELELARDRRNTLWYFEEPSAFPRAWAVRQWVVVASFAEAVTQMTALGTSGRLRDTAVVFDVDRGRLPTASLVGDLERVRVLKVAPGLIELRTASDSAMLVPTNEFFHPAWKLTIDDASSIPLTVDGAFLGAVVPGGSHRVRFER